MLLTFEMKPFFSSTFPRRVVSCAPVAASFTAIRHSIWLVIHSGFYNDSGRRCTFSPYLLFNTRLSLLVLSSVFHFLPASLAMSSSRMTLVTSGFTVLLLPLFVRSLALDAQHTKSVIAQMFEWSWDSIAQECTEFLGPAGECIIVYLYYRRQIASRL